MVLQCYMECLGYSQLIVDYIVRPPQMSFSQLRPPACSVTTARPGRPRRLRRAPVAPGAPGAPAGAAQEVGWRVVEGGVVGVADDGRGV